MAESSSNPTREAESRASIIQAVTSPLGLFVLIFIIIESLLAIFATRASGTDFSVLVYGMVGSFVLLICIVSYFLFAGKSLTTFSITITLSPPEDMSGFKLSAITWNSEKCFVRCGEVERPVKPAFGAGSTFLITLPPEIMTKASASEPVEMELVDAVGFAWRIRPFYLTHISIPLAFEQGKKESIISAYGSRA